MSKKVPSFNIADLEAQVKIDEHSLEEECKKQPDLFYQVAKELAFAISQRDEAKVALAEAEASADPRIRKTLERSEMKVTENIVASMKLTDPEVTKAKDYHLDRSANAGKLSALKEAYEQRSHMLRHLTELYIHSYYGEVGNPKSEKNMREVEYSRGKDALKQGRLRRRSSEYDV